MRLLWIAALLLALHATPVHAQPTPPATVVAADESGHTSTQSGARC